MLILIYDTYFNRRNLVQKSIDPGKLNIIALLLIFLHGFESSQI